MTKRQAFRCNLIIHSASALSAGVGGGLAQFPCTDNALIKPIQLCMTVALGKVFGIGLRKSSAKAAAGSSAAKVVGRAFSQLLTGWIPGAGNVINASTAATLTEAIGWQLAKEFEHSKE